MSKQCAALSVGVRPVGFTQRSPSARLHAPQWAHAGVQRLANAMGERPTQQ